jgi:hypothetical protein
METLKKRAVKVLLGNSLQMYSHIKNEKTPLKEQQHLFLLHWPFMPAVLRPNPLEKLQGMVACRVLVTCS